tara:strand:- start:1541 stop:2440 length:900 start_codon:yes stop_codon:yes gene_type:complete
MFQNHHIDSERWTGFIPRNNDICIATTLKAGTTWTQALVVNLLFPNQDFPKKVTEFSPWLDSTDIPIDVIMRELNEQKHRRVIKTHLPLDALHFFPEIKYIYVSRDGRDVALSLWNHHLNYTPEVYDFINSSGLIGDEFPQPPEDFHTYWREWCTKGWFDWESDGYPFWSHLQGVQSWWNYRHLPNILFLNYADMKKDIKVSIAKIANFLDIDIDLSRIKDVEEKISLTAMRAAAETYVPDGGTSWKGGAQTFIHKGINGRWKDILSLEELKLYELACDKALSTDCRYWLENGGEVLWD